jgi:hypothetical protein
MNLSTKIFRKRFHMLAIPAKLDVVRQVREYVHTRKMPSGALMKEEERLEIVELLSWCDKNIFFDSTPSKFDEPKY